MLDFAARECPGAVLRSRYLSTDGESPSGKAAAFGAAIRRFESSLPSQAARPPALLGSASFRLYYFFMATFSREPKFEPRPLLPAPDWAGNFPSHADLMRSLLTSPLPACYLAVRKSIL